MLCLRATRPTIPLRILRTHRTLTTLPNNPHIYTFPDPPSSGYLLTLLPTTPPTRSLAIGFTPTLLPSPSTFRDNPHFLRVLQSVLKQHATKDPAVQAQARAFATPGAGTFSFGGGAAMGFAGGHGHAGLPANHPANAGRRRTRRGKGEEEAMEARKRGGGVGGWIHVSDERKPPDWARIAAPEDIFGSVQVDGAGEFVGVDGGYQESGTYRVVTNEGVLGLSPFLRDCLVRELRELESTGKF